METTSSEPSPASQGPNCGSKFEVSGISRLVAGGTPVSKESKPSAQTGYYCRNCASLCLSRGAYAQHVESLPNKLHVLELIPPERLWTCPVSDCPYISENLGSVTQHVDAIHPLMCTHCQVDRATFKEFLQHLTLSVECRRSMRNRDLYFRHFPLLERELDPPIFRDMVEHVFPRHFEKRAVVPKPTWSTWFNSFFEKAQSGKPDESPKREEERDHISLITNPEPVAPNEFRKEFQAYVRRARTEQYCNLVLWLLSILTSFFALVRMVRRTNAFDFDAERASHALIVWGQGSDPIGYELLSNDPGVYNHCVPHDDFAINNNPDFSWWAVISPVFWFTLRHFSRWLLGQFGIFLSAHFAAFLHRRARWPCWTVVNFYRLLFWASVPLLWFAPITGMCMLVGCRAANRRHNELFEHPEHPRPQFRAPANYNTTIIDDPERLQAAQAGDDKKILHTLAWEWFLIFARQTPVVFAVGLLCGVLSAGDLRAWFFMLFAAAVYFAASFLFPAIKQMYADYQTARMLMHRVERVSAAPGQILSMFHFRQHKPTERSLELVVPNVSPSVLYEVVSAISYGYLVLTNKLAGQAAATVLYANSTRLTLFAEGLSMISPYIARWAPLLNLPIGEDVNLPADVQLAQVDDFDGTGLVGAILGAFKRCTGISMSAPTHEETVRAITFNRDITTIKSTAKLWEMFNHFIEWSLDLIYPRLYGVRFKTEQALADKCLEWARQTTTRLARMVLTTHVWDTESRLILKDMYDSGNVLVELCQERKIPLSDVPALSKNWDVVRTLYAKYGGAANARRMEPVGVFIFGRRSTGKSSLTAALSHDLAVAHGVIQPEQLSDPGEYLYMVREAGTDDKCFRDDYKKQLVTVYNDVFNVQDDKTRANLITELMGILDHTMYKMNAAAVEKKDNLAFESYYVLLTTNNPRVFTAEIHKDALEAFYSRWRIVVQPACDPLPEEDLELVRIEFLEKRIRALSKSKLKTKYTLVEQAQAEIDEIWNARQARGANKGKAETEPTLLKRKDIDPRSQQYRVGRFQETRDGVAFGSISWETELYTYPQVMKLLLVSAREKYALMKHHAQLDLSVPVDFGVDLPLELVRQTKTPEKFEFFVPMPKSDHWHQLFVGAFGILSFYGLYKVVQHLTSSDEEDGQYQIQRRPRHKKTIGPRTGVTTYSVESGHSSTLVEDTKALVQKNLAILVFRGDYNMKCYAFCIRGRTYMTALHCFDTWVHHYQENTLEKIKVYLDGREISPRAIHLVQDGDRHLAVFTVRDPTLNARRDLTSKFVTHLPQTLIRVPITIVDTVAPYTVTMDGRYATKSTMMHVESGPHQYVEEIKCEKITVPIPGINGDCGRIFMFHPVKGSADDFGTICAFHISGRAANQANPVSTGVITTRKLIETLATKAERLGVKGDVEVAQSGEIPDPRDLLVKDGKPMFEIKPPNKFVGVLPPNKSGVIPNADLYRPSVFYEAFEGNTAPPMFHKHERNGRFISPMQESLDKRAVPIHDIPERAMRIAEHIGDRMLKEFRVIRECRVLTEREAINGSKDFYYLNRIPIAKGAGWRFMGEKPDGNPNRYPPEGILRKMRGKVAWFDSEFDPNEPDDDYKRYFVPGKTLRKMLESAKTQRWCRVMLNALKPDERRALQKVLVEGEEVLLPKLPRGLSGDDIVFFLLDRMYDGAFVDMMMSNYPKNPCKVGINPHNRHDWLELADYLKLFVEGRVIFAGDIKSFGYSVPKKIVRLGLSLIETWYETHGNQTVEEIEFRRWLHHTMQHNYEVAGNVLWEAAQGGRDGLFLTTILNCLCNEIMSRTSWCMSALTMAEAGSIKDRFTEALFKLKDQTAREIYCVDECFIQMLMAVFGDDLVDTHPLKWLTSEKFAAMYKYCFGMELTHPKKSGADLPDSFPVEEVQFLKRTFTKDGHARLDKAVIEDMARWRTKKVSDYDAVHRIINTVLLESYHWGREYFESMKSRLYKVAFEQGFEIDHTKIKFDNYDLNHEKWLNFKLEELPWDDEYLIETAQSQSWDDLSHEIAQSGKVEGTEASEQGTVTKTTETDAITSFDDQQKPEMAIVSGPVNRFAEPNPYPTVGLAEFLGRERRLTVQWTAADAPGTLILARKYPYADSQYPQIMDKLAFNRYGRWAKKIGVRLTSPRSNYAAAMLSWHPAYNVDSTSETYGPNSGPMALYSMSQWNHIILDVQRSGATEFIIPWVGPENYFDIHKISDPADPNSWAIGGFIIRCLTQIKTVSAGTAQPVEIVISEQIINLELAGYEVANSGDPDVSTTPPQREEVVVYESTGVSLESVSVEHLEIEGDEELPEEWLDQTAQSGKATKKPASRGLMKRGGPVKEALDRSELGVISGTAQAVADVATVLEEVPIVGGVASMIAPVAQMASSLASLWGWDRPTAVRAIQPVQNWTFDNLSHGSGLDSVRKLCIDPENRVIATQDRYNCADKLDFQSICGTPALISTDMDIDQTTTVGQIIATYPVTPTMCYMTQSAPDPIVMRMTPCGTIASGFMRWHGDMKFALYIISSEFMKTRISIIHTTSLSNLDTVAGRGDTVQKVVDVLGSTVVTFTLPYLHKKPWLPVAPFAAFPPSIYANPDLTDQHNGWLVIRLESPLVALETAVVPQVHMFLYAAAGENMRFQGPIGGWLDWQMAQSGDPDHQYAQAGGAEDDAWIPRQLFSKTFDPLVPASTTALSKVSYGEEVQDVMTRLHTYEDWGVLSSNYDYTFKWWERTTGLHKFWSTLWQFWAGSIRLAVPMNSASVVMVIPQTDGGIPNVGTTSADLGLSDTCRPKEYQLRVDRAAISVEVPYGSNLLFSSTQPNTFTTQDPKINNEVYFPRLYNGDGEPFVPYFAFGDDFSFGWQRSPAVLVHAAMPSLVRAREGKNEKPPGYRHIK